MSHLYFEVIFFLINKLIACKCRLLRVLFLRGYKLFLYYRVDTSKSKLLFIAAKSSVKIGIKPVSEELDGYTKDRCRLF